MKKGFTLIELLAVIVVLAILALVVTPIVLNIVENAQTGSDERSLEAYAKVVQSTYYEQKMKDPTLTLEDYLSKVDTASGATLTYNGSKVECSERNVVEAVSGTQSIELRNCTVDGRGLYNFIDGKAIKTGSYKKYENGEVVYFDVSNEKICDNYHKDNSNSGYKGTNPTGNQTSCLKFYAFNDSSESKNLNLLLDHNTTSEICWNTNFSNAKGPTDIINKLKEDTKDWKGTIEPEAYTLNQTGQKSNAKYTINYSGYKARLITANEVAKITGKTAWDETTATSMYYFSSLESSISGSVKGCAGTGCKWLYDKGSYWTSTSGADTSEHAWYIDVSKGTISKGLAADYGSNGFVCYVAGVRPVITITKP